ncbi:MAG: hypothetical protein HY348_04935 [Nitrospira defluvii]|nr:hypothetical protein [Nitrospira defluvii]
MDISQQEGQPPKVLLGYKREEGVFLPSPHRPGNETIVSPEKENAAKASAQKDETKNNNQVATKVSDSKTDGQPPQSAPGMTTTNRTDTYSVVSFFCVMANPSLWDFIKGLTPFSKNVPDGLQIHAFFATGVAAQHASERKEVREFYKQAAASQTERAEKRCF